MFLNNNKIKLVLIFLAILFVSSLYFLTGKYLNFYKKPFQRNIERYLDIDKIKFEKIEGNFNKGFKISNLTLDSDDYFFSIGHAYISFSFFDFLNGFNKIDYLTFKDAILKLKINNSSEIETDYLRQFQIDRIAAENFQILHDKNSFLIEKLDASLTSGILYNVEFSGLAKFPYYNIEANKFHTKLLDDSYDFDIVLEKSNPANLTFDKLDISGQISDDLSTIKGEFKVSNVLIFDKEFYDIDGEIQYYDNTFFFDVKNQHDLESAKKKFSIGANLEFSNSLLKIKKGIIQFNPTDSIVVENDFIRFNNNEFFAEKLYLKYGSGGALIKNAKIDKFYSYNLDIDFDNLDIRIFKGLGANGYLTGKLNIINGDSIYFKDAKVENFSYKDYSFDSVDIEGSFNNNELSLSGLKISKQIGLLNLSGSYSSLDDFYSEFIKGLRLKFKN